MKKAIPKDWVDIIKTENFQKSVVNICKKKYVLIKGNPYRFSILKNTFLYELLLIAAQVIKFTSCLPMVGGSLRVLRLHPPLKLVAMI